MSKVKYIYEEEYICDCLDILRKCNETRDYSMLLATVERIQVHANRMEAGLQKGWSVRTTLEDEEMSDKEKLEKIGKIFNVGKE